MTNFNLQSFNSDPDTFQRYQKYRADNFLNIEIFENDRWYHRMKRNVFG